MLLALGEELGPLSLEEEVAVAEAKALSLEEKETDPLPLPLKEDVGEPVILALGE